MGCDIHSYAEVKREKGWVKVGPVFKNPSYPDYSEEEYTDEPYGDRSYTVFGILAGVRSRYTGNPISRPKGIPKDVTEGVKSEWNIWRGNGHSASYLTLKELMSFDWVGAGERSFLEDVISQLRLLTCYTRTNLEEDDTENIRMVFWFDN